mgnify:CR=1 FL=1
MKPDVVARKLVNEMVCAGIKMGDSDRIHFITKLKLILQDKEDEISSLELLIQSMADMENEG